MVCMLFCHKGSCFSWNKQEKSIYFFCCTVLRGLSNGYATVFNEQEIDSQTIHYPFCSIAFSSFRSSQCRVYVAHPKIPVGRMSAGRTRMISSHGWSRRFFTDGCSPSKDADISIARNVERNITPSCPLKKRQKRWIYTSVNVRAELYDL